MTNDHATEGSETGQMPDPAPEPPTDGMPAPEEQPAERWGGTRDHKPSHNPPGRPPGPTPQWGGTRSPDEPDPAA